MPEPTATPTTGNYQFDPGDDEGPTGPAALPSYPKNRVVSNFAHLQALIPDYENRSLNQILASPLFTGPNAYQLNPDFVSDLYTALLQIESGTGVSIGDFASEVPAGVVGSKSAFDRLLSATDTDSGRGPAPDVVGTANAWMNYYELQVRNGLMPYEQAVAERDRKFEELNAVIDTEIAQGTFEQNAAIATNQAQSQFDANQLRQQEEFGRRSQSMVRDFLPNFMPGLTGANIPGVTGTMPVPQVNPDQIYGLGALAGAGPTAPVPVPNPQITPFDPSQLPAVPNYTPPPLPNILGLLGVG